MRGSILHQLLLRRHAFLVNNRPGLVTAMPFVRRRYLAICWVPQKELSHTPRYSIPTHLCQFPVQVYHFVECRLSFFWEYDMCYFNVIIFGYLTLARRMFSSTWLFSFPISSLFIHENLYYILLQYIVKSPSLKVLIHFSLNFKFIKSRNTHVVISLVLA